MRRATRRVGVSPEAGPERARSAGRARALGAALLLLPAVACSSPDKQALRQETLEALLIAAEEVPEETVPTIDLDDGGDWIRLSSGEWIRGEIVSYNDDSLEFDSDDLGTLNIDWGDAAEVHTSRLFTVMLEGRTQMIGRVRVLGDEVYLVSADGTRRVSREDLFRMVPGEPRELNYWSGRVSVGFTGRSGNTNSEDLNTTVYFLRRTARSRLPIDYNANYGKLEDEANTDNQRLRSQYDWYLGRQLFVTPLGFELYADRFQNLEMRATPYAALGYTLIDESRIEWSLTAGYGYRYTEFISTPEGVEDPDTTANAIFATRVGWEPTSTLDVDFDYTAQIGLPDTTDTNQGATLILSLDLLFDLDLDVQFRWDRVGLPRPDEDGSIPEQDDFRTTIGLGWDF